jgi:4-amino-4-deoxy-L-arabinose transferase-like glycosyltransferase
MKKFLSLLAVIWLIGLTLRLVYFSQTMPIQGDAARDLLVGWHMLKYGEIPLLGQTASGIPVDFAYPPYYFWFIGALMWIAHGNTLSILLFFVILRSSEILLVGLVGARLFGKSAGIAAAIFMAFASNVISEHITMYSGPLGTPFALLSVYIFLRSWQLRKRVGVFAAIALVFVAASFSYSAWTLLPIYFLGAFFGFHARRLLVQVLAWSGLLFITFHMLLLPAYGLRGILHAYSPLTLITFRDNFVSHVISRTQLFGNSYFLSFPTLFLVAAGLLVLLEISHARKLMPRMMWLACWVALILILAGAKTDVFSSHYFAFIVPFFPVAAGALVSIGFASRKSFMGVVLAIVASVSLITSTVQKELPGFGGVPWQEAQRVSQAIYSAAYQIQQKEAFPDMRFFQTSSLVPEGDGESATLWYFLERTTGEKRIAVSKEGALLPQTDNYYIFLYCRNWQREADCVNMFADDHPDHLLVKPIPSAWGTIYLWKRTS